MTDAKDPAAVWYTHVGRQVWRAYCAHPRSLQELDGVDEHRAAETVMRDLDKLAALNVALNRAAVDADRLCGLMKSAREAVEAEQSARAAADAARSERDRAVAAAKAAELERDRAVEFERRTYDLHKELIDRNDKPSARRVLMWLAGGMSYTSWLGLVK